MGSQIIDLKDKSTQLRVPPEELALEVATVPKDVPRVRVDYVDDGRTGGKGTLVFKSDKLAIIKNVGALVLGSGMRANMNSA